MKEIPPKTASSTRPIYLRLEAELVSFLDQEARRQHRSRAFVMAQACRLFQAVRQQWEKELPNEL